MEEDRIQNTGYRMGKTKASETGSSKDRPRAVGGGVENRQFGPLASPSFYFLSPVS
jgi:hypothetical protein